MSLITQYSLYSYSLSKAFMLLARGVFEGISNLLPEGLIGAMAPTSSIVNGKLEDMYTFSSRELFCRRQYNPVIDLTGEYQRPARRRN